MNPIRSLQGRISLILSVAIAGLWVATSLVTASIVEREVDSFSDSALMETAQRILPLAVIDIINAGDLTPDQHVAPLRIQDEVMSYVVRDRAGKVLMRSHGASEKDFPAFEGTGFAETPRLRLYHDVALKGEVTISVAEPLSHRRAIARQTLLALVVPTLILFPLALLMIALVIRWSLTPVRQVNEAIARRGAADLSALAVSGLPSEIVPSVREVNRLLARIRQALEAERSFTANAAHELRTPVAAALAQIQRLESESHHEQVLSRARAAQASLKKLNRLSEKLMQLARAEGAQLRQAQAADIRRVVELTVADCLREQPERHLALSLPDQPVLSDIDADALSILLRNLIENALKHGADPVAVSLSRDAVLSVSNGGPAISADLQSGLTQRFVRGQSAASGTGLGLAIVRAIAEGSGSKFQLVSPSQPDGTAVSITIALPRGAETSATG